MPPSPCRVFCLVLLLLCLTFDAHAQTPAPTPPAAYHWRAIVLQHVTPGDVLSLMHWEGSKQLPEGVRLIQPFPNSNALALESTDEGFTEVKRFIKILDIAPFAMEPTILSLEVPANEAGLNWNTYQPFPIEMLSGAETDRAFARLVHAGHVPVKVERRHVKFNSLEPQTWDLSAYRLQNPRLNSDNSLQLQVRLRNPHDKTSAFLFEGPTPHLSRGGVLAIKTKNSPTVIFIKVDY